MRKFNWNKCNVIAYFEKSRYDYEDDAVCFNCDRDKSVVKMKTFKIKVKIMKRYLLSDVCD